MSSDSMNPETGIIVPDYTMPSALMVPHYPSEGESMLEQIATIAARHVGVILLSQVPEYSMRFIAGQPDTDRFTVVGAVFDTPWIRDRSPIAVSRGEDLLWVLPQLPDMKRAKDDDLFRRVISRTSIPTSIQIEQGNLVAGPDGLVLSTHRVLQVNGFADAEPLIEAAGPLGVKRWIFFPPFADELSGHADVHARFLKEDLLAVAWNPEDKGNQSIAELIGEQVLAANPDIRIIRIPMRRDGRMYGSLVNWIQLGEHLLVPRYPITPEDDIEKARELLSDCGYICHFIDSPTAELGGSLHCMTASIFV